MAINTLYLHRLLLTGIPAMDIDRRYFVIGVKGTDWSLEQIVEKFPEIEIVEKFPEVLNAKYCNQYEDQHQMQPAFIRRTR